MDRATYYCVVCRSGLWRKAKFNHRCWICDDVIGAGQTYLDTGMQKHNATQKWHTHKVCFLCSAKPVTLPDHLPDADPFGMTDYGLRMLEELKLIVRRKPSA